MRVGAVIRPASVGAAASSRPSRAALQTCAGTLQLSAIACSSCPGASGRAIVLSWNSRASSLGHGILDRVELGAELHEAGVARDERNVPIRTSPTVRSGWSIANRWAM